MCESAIRWLPRNAQQHIRFHLYDVGMSRLGILEGMVVLLHAQERQRPVAVEIATAWIQLNAMRVVKHGLHVFVLLHTLVASLLTGIRRSFHLYYFCAII